MKTITLLLSGYSLIVNLTKTQHQKLTKSHQIILPTQKNNVWKRKDFTTTIGL